MGAMTDYLPSNGNSMYDIIAGSVSVPLCEIMHYADGGVSREIVEQWG